jgi:uncharacterized cupredoxin-like copper-binding protein
MNGEHAGTSARVQGAWPKTLLDSAPNRAETEQENTMLRKLSAALIATALIASPAFAAASSAAASTPSAVTTSAPTNTKHAGKPIKTVKHQHKRFVHHKLSKSKPRGHIKLAGKTHRHVVKTNKTVKTSKTVKTANTANSGRTNKITKPVANTHG